MRIGRRVQKRKPPPLPGSIKAPYYGAALAVVVGVVPLYAIIPALPTLVRVLHLDGSRMTIFSAIAGALAGVAAGACSTLVRRHMDKRAGQTKTGQLDIRYAMWVLELCDPEQFTTEEFKLRSQLNRHLERLAWVIARIPKKMGVPSKLTTDAVAARVAGILAIQDEVAAMTAAGKSKIEADLRSAKLAYDSGKWMDLPVAEPETVKAQSTGARAALATLAVISFCGIAGVVILSAMSKVPQMVAAPLATVLGLILYAALAKLGLSPQSMKDALEITAKGQTAVLPKAADEEDK